ncbi:MAG: hypothetical protein HRT47_09325 [Candidatus Caenarcaniphilales bacterium]|nr:hypothetical protein [Candidatus Caenarcaniphilales bacterium]
MRKIFLSFQLIALLFICFPAKANITDPFFGGDGPDNGSFFMRIKDSRNNNKISNQKRKITIQLFFLNRFYDEINRVNDLDLAAAFNRSLRSRALLKKKSQLQASKQGIKFFYKDISNEDRDKKYNRVSFVSENIIISDPQRINFSFDQEEFADYLDVSIDESSNYNKGVKYRPLSTEIESFDGNVNEDTKIVRITGTFTANSELNLSTTKFSFKFKEKSKRVKPIAKKGKRKLRLTADLVEDSPAEVTRVNDDSLDYQVNLPITLNTKNKSILKRYKEDETYEVTIPVLLEATTSSGLEFEVKATIKEQFTNFLKLSD